MENKTTKINVRQWSLDIVYTFEQFLDDYNITIPDDFLEDDDGDTRIYRETWNDLFDEITGILQNLIVKIKENPEAEIYLVNYE